MLGIEHRSLQEIDERRRHSDAQTRLGEGLQVGIQICEASMDRRVKLELQGERLIDTRAQLLLIHLSLAKDPP